MTDEVIRLDRVCRGCLKEEGDMRSLFRIEEAVDRNTPRLNQMLTSSTQIRIMENDGLPCQICVHCANKLYSAYSFKHMCESSDAKLRKYVSKVNPTAIIQNCHQNHNATGVKQEGNLSLTGGTDIIDFNTMFNSELPSIKTEIHEQSDVHLSLVDREERNPTNPNEKHTQTRVRDLAEIYNCPQCQKIFSCLSGLNQHLSKHGKKKFAPCSACGKIFSSLGHLKIHTVEDHSVKIPEKNPITPLLNCQICKSAFDEVDQLKKHMAVHGKKKIYNCESCERGFNHSENYETHTTQCKGKKYACESCDVTFSKLDLLNTHNETVHESQRETEVNKNKTPPIVVPLKTEGDSNNELNLPAIKENLIELEVTVKEEPLEELLEEAEREQQVLDDDHDFSDEFDNQADILDFEDNDGDIKSENSDYKPPDFKVKRRVGRPRKDSFAHKKKHKLKHLKLDIGQNDSLAVRYPCEVCPKMLGSNLALKIHMAKHAGSGPYGCMICGKSFNTVIRLKRHELTHGISKRYKCNSCDKTFNRQDHLNKHMWQHMENKPHQCDMCPRGFMRSEHLERHKAALHSGKEKNPKTTFCPICNRGFTTEKYLETHMRMHTGDKTFTCKVCEKSFNSKWHLKEHNKWHSAEKPFLCSECGQRFIRNDYLVIHMRRHKGEKPYKCKFCGKGFPRATDLTVHERYHTGEKTHLCTVCGKGFQRQYNLTVHLRVHTGEKPYVCSYCGKRFAQGNDLKSHVRRHTGERYNCEVCGEGFIQGYHLTQHKRSVHGIDCSSHIRRVEKHPQANPQNQPNHVPSKHRNRAAAHQQDLAAHHLRTDPAGQ